MRFTLALPMCPADRLLTLARIADESGWDAVSMPDSVVVVCRTGKKRLAEVISAETPPSAPIREKRPRCSL